MFESIIKQVDILNLDLDKYKWRAKGNAVIHKIQRFDNNIINKMILLNEVLHEFYSVTQNAQSCNSNISQI